MSNREQAGYPPLERGQVIPIFTLPGADGMPHSPWDYKQREHLLLIFIESTKVDEARALLRTFAQQYRALREERCSLLAISVDPVIVNLQAQEELRLPFPLVSDPGGSVVSRYTGWDSTRRSLTPCMVLADRYNALYERWISEQMAELPDVQEILEALQYLNSICTP